MNEERLKLLKAYKRKEEEAIRNADGDLLTRKEHESRFRILQDWIDEMEWVKTLVGVSK